MSNRIDGKNLDQYIEEQNYDLPEDEYDDLEDEYGDDPSYERMNKQRGLKKMRW